MNIATEAITGIIGTKEVMMLCKKEALSSVTCSSPRFSGENAMLQFQFNVHSRSESTQS